MEDPPHQLAELARGLRADLQGAVPELLVQLACGVSGGTMRLSELVRVVEGYSPEPYPWSIDISVRGRTKISLVFYYGLDLVDQIQDSVSQVQDVIVEELRDIWPPCPVHGDMLMVTRRSGGVYWECAKASEVSFKLGQLGAASKD